MGIKTPGLDAPQHESAIINQQHQVNQENRPWGAIGNLQGEHKSVHSTETWHPGVHAPGGLGTNQMAPLPTFTTTTGHQIEIYLPLDADQCPKSQNRTER